MNDADALSVLLKLPQRRVLVQEVPAGPPTHCLSKVTVSSGHWTYEGGRL